MIKTTAVSRGYLSPKGSPSMIGMTRPGGNANIKTPVMLKAHKSGSMSGSTSRSSAKIRTTSR